METEILVGLNKKKAIMDIRIENNGVKSLVYTPYNKAFISRIRQISGSKWNGSAWEVDTIFVPAVREICQKVYGYDDTQDEEKLVLKLTFLEERIEYNADIVMFGKTITSAWSRDSGARVGEDVAFVSGNAHSGGSSKNWTSNVSEGSVVMLKNVSKTLYERRKDLYDSKEVKVEVIGEDKPVIDGNALLKEKEALLKRLEEIDKLLAQM